MNRRPTSSILAALADEVSDMSEIARLIENAFCEIGPGIGERVLSADFQRLDFLRQHLGDVGAVLRKMAGMVNAAESLDAAELGSAAQLDFLRRRLRDHGSRDEKTLHSGHVDLF